MLRGRLETRRQHPLDEQKLCLLGDGAAAAVQDCGSTLITPVVKDVLEDVNISPTGYRFEEVAGKKLAPICMPHVFQILARARHGMRQLEQNAVSVRVSLEAR